MPKLNGTYFVTGVAMKSSICWAIAQQIRNDGGEVILASHPSMSRFIEKLAAEAGIAQWYFTDVNRPDEMDALFAEMEVRGVRLSGIVHGIAASDPAEMKRAYSDITAKNFSSTMLISCWSLIDICKRSKPLMQPSCSIITLSFDASRGVYEGYNLMSTAKAALESVAMNLAADLGQYGHRVNVISPSPERTLSAKGVPGYLAIGAMAELTSFLGGRASMEGIGKLASFLLSEDSSDITGEVFRIDRGSGAAKMPLRRNADNPAENSGDRLGEYFLKKLRE